MSKEIAVHQEKALDGLPEDFLKELESESKENLKDDDHPYLRLSTKGSDFKVGVTSVSDVKGNFAGVILGSQKVNIFYSKPYNPSAVEAPECFSIGGIIPSAPNPPSKECATCPNHAFGSRININGKKVTACAETRRIVLALIDKDNMVSPILYRMSLPVTSLKNYSVYLKQLTIQKLPVWAVMTIFGFDPTVDYPKITFANSEVLPYDTLLELKTLKSSPLVKEILNEYSGFTSDMESVSSETDTVIPQDSNDDEIPF